MVNVTYTKNNHQAELTLTGHANWAPRGRDIVCAAVSTLVIALVTHLEKTSKGNDGSFVMKDGYAYLCSKNKNDLPFFDFVYSGLLRISQHYPHHVKVSMRE